MNITQLKDIKRKYKVLYNNQIYAYKLQIIDCMNCLLTDNITDEDYLKLYCEIEKTYLKLDNITIYKITECAIKHIRCILDDDKTFDLSRECCWLD